MKRWCWQWKSPVINGTLLPYKLFYLSQFSGLACMTPFLPVFYHLRGLTESQIGFLGFLRPMTSVPTVPLWSALADLLGLKKAILLVTVLGGTLFRFLYMYSHSLGTLILLVVLANTLGGAPLVLADAFTMEALDDKTDYGKQRLWGAVGWGLAAWLCGAVVTSTRIEAMFYMHAFFMLATAIVATQFRFENTRRGCYSHLDAETDAKIAHFESNRGNANATQLESNRDLEQQIELHAVDYISSDAESTPMSGRIQAESRSPTADSSILLEPGISTPSNQLNQVSISSIDPSRKENNKAHSGENEALLAPFTKQHADSSDQRQLERSGAGNASNSPSTKPAKSTQPSANNPPLAPKTTSQTRSPPPEDLQAPPTMFAKLTALFGDPSICSFFLIITIMGFAMGTIEGFLPLRLNELGGSPTIIGLSLTVTCVAEVPMMWFSGRLIKSLGVLGVLYLALGCYVARFAYYSLLVEPWAVLPIELLHGVTFGCGWTAGTVHSGRIAPPGLAATMQALFSGAYFGVGNGLGMLLGGVVYERYGSVVLFRGAGLLVTAGALLFGLSQRWFPMKHHEEELPKNGEELQDAVPFKKGHQMEDSGV